MYHYTYRITNTKLNKHYYGTRSSKIEPKEDIGIYYFSSSKDKWFIQDQKNNPQDYRYKILYIFSTRKEAIEMEIKLHNKFNVGINESFFNKSKQTSTGFDINTGHTKKHSLLSKYIMAKNKGYQLYKDILADIKMYNRLSGLNFNKFTKKYLIMDSNNNIVIEFIGQRAKFIKLIKEKNYPSEFYKKVNKGKIFTNISSSEYKKRPQIYDNYKYWEIISIDVKDLIYNFLENEIHFLENEYKNNKKYIDLSSNDKIRFHAKKQSKNRNMKELSEIANRKCWTRNIIIYDNYDNVIFNENCMLKDLYINDKTKDLPLKTLIRNKNKKIFQDERCSTLTRLKNNNLDMFIGWKLCI